MTPVNLLCLPFAGGSKYSYTGYAKYLDNGLKMHALELPGRGARLRENLLYNIEAQVDDLIKQVGGSIRDPYAIYGHSMGTVLGFLMTRKIIASGMRPPLYLFMTGRGGPSVSYNERQYHSLERPAFIEALKDLGGCPEEILNNASLMELYEPILRADFKALAEYKYAQGPSLPIPIMVMYGRQEKVTHQQACLWQRETIYPIEVKAFEGNHFFIYNHEQQIMSDIAKRLLNLSKCYRTTNSSI